MPQTTKPSPKNSKTGSRLTLILLIVLVLVIPTIYYLYNHSFLSPRNYAQEVAQPLEDALIKAGAVKKCSASDNGRTIDNREPRYQVFFEIPGNKEQVAATLRAAFEKVDLQLSEGPYPGTREDNDFYSDLISKKSPYSDLENGNADFLVTVYGSSVYNNQDQIWNRCTILKADKPLDRLIVDVTVNLPSFKQ